MDQPFCCVPGGTTRGLGEAVAKHTLGYTSRGKKGFLPFFRTDPFQADWVDLHFWMFCRLICVLCRRGGSEPVSSGRQCAAGFRCTGDFLTWVTHRGGV